MGGREHFDSEGSIAVGIVDRWASEGLLRHWVSDQQRQRVLLRAAQWPRDDRWAPEGLLGHWVCDRQHQRVPLRAAQRPRDPDDVGECERRTLLPDRLG